VVPSIGRARPRETVESTDASARGADIPVEIVLAWQSSSAPPTLPASARVIEVLPLGVSHAKNRALAHVTAPVIAFVDDDELVDPHWARGLLSTFAANPDVGAVFGAIAPLDDRGLAYCSYEGDVERRYSGASTAPWLVGGGGNMALRRDMLERLRGFDVVFGGGTVSLSAEDTELAARVLYAGKEVLWTPAAVAYHPTKTEQERLESRAPYAFGMAKLVRRHRDVMNGARYTGYAVQSYWTGVRTKNRRRRREAAATLRGFAAGVRRRTSWLAPRQLLELVPEPLRAEVDVSRVEPLPVHYRANPHLVYLLDGKRVLHVYAAPAAELRRALADREVIRQESQLTEIPALLAQADGRDSLWVIEERLPSAGRAVSHAEAFAWATALAKPLGPPLRETDGWDELRAELASPATRSQRADAAEALDRLGALPAAHAHGDFQRKNVLSVAGRVTVFDWEWARARDLPGADVVFYAVTGGGAPSAEVVLSLARGGEPLDVELRPYLAELGVRDDEPLRDLLLVLLVRWAASEHRRLSEWGARPARAVYAELLARCAPALTPVSASLA
jgi:GT2 family glycosyltransferase